MLEIGSVVNARVESIETYGAYLRLAEERIFVDHGNYSWRRGENPLRDVRIGDSIAVRILRYAYPKRTAVGSFKHVDPEANPYRHLSRLDPDTCFEGRVMWADSNGATVELSVGPLGRVPGYKLTHEPNPGDRMMLRIHALEVEEGDLLLEPAEPT